MTPNHRINVPRGPVLPPPQWLAGGLKGYDAPGSCSSSSEIVAWLQAPVQADSSKFRDSPAADPNLYDEADLPHGERPFLQTNEQPDQQAYADLEKPSLVDIPTPPAVDSEGYDDSMPPKAPLVFAKPECAADPNFVQPSIAGLTKRDELGRPLDQLNTPPPIEYAPPPPAPIDYRTGGLPEPATPGYRTPGGGQPQSSLYTGTLPGAAESRPAVVDGIPTYIPPDPSESRFRSESDPSRFGRNTAGVATLLCGAIGAVPTFVAPEAELMGFSRAFLISIWMVPSVLIALLLFFGEALSLIFAWIFVILAASAQALVGMTMLGLNLVEESPIQFNPQAAYPFLAKATALPFAMLLMTIARPGPGRAIFGSIVVVMTYAAALIYSSIVGDTTQLRATERISGWEEITFGSSLEGIRFVKPQDFAQFEWTNANLLSPLAQGLRTRPNYLFFDRNQDVMVTVYSETAPRRGILGLIGGVFSELEEEVTHGLSRDPAQTFTFNYDGITFTRDQYAGISREGNLIAITVDKARTAERIFYIVATTRFEGGANAERRGEILNKFHETMEFP